MVEGLERLEKKLVEVISFVEDGKISHCIKCGVNLAGYVEEAECCRDCAIESYKTEDQQIVCEQMIIIEDDLHDLVRTLLNYNMATAQGIWLSLSTEPSVTGKRCKQCAACKLLDGMYTIVHNEDQSNGPVDLVRSFKDLQGYFNL